MTFRVNMNVDQAHGALIQEQQAMFQLMTDR